MEAAKNPPVFWDRLVQVPCQTSGFAQAMRHLGYSPLYLWEDNHGALALLRGNIRGLTWLTARANLFVTNVEPEFLTKALQTLGTLGISHVKVGDTMWGPRWEQLPTPWTFPRTQLVRRHTFILDLQATEETLLKHMDGAARKIRKAEKEGVTVRSVVSPEELSAFCVLAEETADRVRRRSAYTDFPPSFFRTLYQLLSPSGRARFYVAWYKDQPLAACVFLCSADTMLYYLGGSSRDRELTAKQAPSALFWHAIQEAQRLGLRRFDFGGCTPTDDPNDSRYGVYTFKKRWGGRLEHFANLDVVLSTLPYYFQEQVLSPLWDRLHPFYFKFFAQK